MQYPPVPFWGRNRLYGFELKTSHDEPYRFLTQLPRYCWFFDEVWLVLAEGLKIPRRLPKWVGVYQQEGEEFIKVRGNFDGFRGFLGTGAVDIGKYFFPNYQGQSSPTFWRFINFLRKVFIHGLFKEPIDPFDHFDRGLVDILYYIQRSENPYHELVNRKYTRKTPRPVSFEDIVKITRKLTRGNQTDLEMFNQEDPEHG